MSSKDPLDMLERLVQTTESAKATPEEIATWEAEKAAVVAAREKHAAHMDRAERRAVEQMAIDERQADALERIAVAVEALAGVLTAKPVVPECPNAGDCHGEATYCPICGDVWAMCAVEDCCIHADR
jgi:hypothetical protein